MHIHKLWPPLPSLATAKHSWTVTSHFESIIGTAHAFTSTMSYFARETKPPPKVYKPSGGNVRILGINYQHQRENSRSASESEEYGPYFDLPSIT